MHKKVRKNIRIIKRMAFTQKILYLESLLKMRQRFLKIKKTNANIKSGLDHKPLNDHP